MNIFEQASKIQLRFRCDQGNFHVEDLWNCSLGTLDAIAIKINKFIKESEENSFIKKTTDVLKKDKLRLSILVHIINVKLEEVEASKLAAENRLVKQKLLEALETRQSKDLSKLSSKELQKQIDELT